MSQKLTPGDKAPGFELTDDQGRTTRLDDYRGQAVIVYFYPKAETPGCTTEACDFRDNIASLGASGYAVVGISPDEPAALAGFRDNHQLSFPLLADPDHSVAEAWGAWGEKTVNGKQVSGIVRSTFVVDGDGTLRLTEYNVSAQGHVAALRDQLERT